MFGTAEEELSAYIPRGIVTWSESVSAALDMGHLAFRAVSEADVNLGRPLTVLLEGAPKAGKTALAVEIARRSGFPFLKIVTTHKMIGFTETAKCASMKKVTMSSIMCLFFISHMHHKCFYIPTSITFVPSHDFLFIPLKYPMQLL
ncbi:unnamed protein product [Protopolystoma xenopodis]|uniref:Vesicle-fusing ATPase n=1 Tax=Protopolystoma xenopodis TaxID=117903 RepID=A0A3S5CQW2_9PLAT|nr:unnamed protein product [Protopolystoma xenopodis]